MEIYPSVENVNNQVTKIQQPQAQFADSALQTSIESSF